MENKDSFNSALYGVSERIREKLIKLPLTVRQGAEEIRLRTGLPVALTVGGETVFVLESGRVSFYITQGLLKAEKRDVEESFRLLCKNSAFAHSEELKNGVANLNDTERNINYILTYEAPTIAKDILKQRTNQNIIITPLNTYLQEIMHNVEYMHWYFGSLHIDLNISKKMTAVFNEIIEV